MHHGWGDFDTGRPAVGKDSPRLVRGGSKYEAGVFRVVPIAMNCHCELAFERRNGLGDLRERTTHDDDGARPEDLFANLQ